MMIAHQRPDATHVAGYRKWLELGRHVKKGEKGIAILAPLSYRRKTENDDGEEITLHHVTGFRVVHVFDVSQTEGQPLPELAGVSGDARELVPRIEKVIRRQGISLSYETLIGAEGYSAGGKIVGDERLQAEERFAVLCHELGHEKLHQGQRRHETTKTIRETEAEAVAFVVCRAFGLESLTRSADYIQLHRGDVEVLAESLDFIRKVSAEIIEALRSDDNSAANESVGQADAGQPPASLSTVPIHSKGET